MKLLVLPGDGIGPEITAATVAVLEAADRAPGARPQAMQRASRSESSILRGLGRRRSKDPQ
jgi:isocitrate/isopropylmalate dehydrogenase